MRVAVVGGGILGWSIALRLSQQGAEVTVCSRPQPDARPCPLTGLLAPQLEAHGPGPHLEASVRSRAMFPAFLDELRHETGLQVPYRPCGALRLAQDEDEAHRLDAEGAWQRACGLRAELLGAREARALEPSLREPLVAALHLPDDHWVDGPALRTAVEQAARRAGATSRPFLALSLLSKPGSGLALDGAPLLADAVVVSGGAAALPALARFASSWALGPLPLPSCRLCVARAPTLALAGPTAVVVPQGGTEVAIAHWIAHDRLARRTPLPSSGDLVDQVAQMWAFEPDPTPVRTTTGNSWECSDGLPVVGPLPMPGLSVAAGFSRSTALLAPLVARRVADGVLDRRTTVESKAWRPSRFKAA